jgi:hypothetical protein
MRALRTLVGVVALLAGGPMLLLAGVGWSVLRLGPDAEGLAPTRAFVRTEARAVLVVDAAALADRARVSVVPGSDRVRVTVRSGSGPLFVALAPTGLASGYLDEVARAELSGTGGLVEVAGRAVPTPAAGQTFWAQTAARRDTVHSLEWTPRPDTSLVIMRSDGQGGIDATVGLGSYPAWLGAGTWWLLVGGVVAVLAGLGLLAWPQRRREVVLVVEAHRMVDFADRIVDRLDGSPALVHRGRHHDMTGEVVRLDRVAPPRSGRAGRDRYVNDTGRVTALEPNQGGAALREGTGESPYVSTAT